MKIAVIGHKRVPSREGGIEKTVEKQMRLLRSRGHEILFLNRSGHNLFGEEYDQPAEAWQEQGISICSVPTPKGAGGVAVYSFLATLRAVREKCDVIYYHGSGPCLMISLAKAFGVPCVAMLHGIDSGRAKWGRFGRWYLRMGERAAARKADCCLVLSENMKQQMAENYGCRAVLTHNGAEPPLQVENSGEMLSRSFGLQKNGYVLTLVRIVPEKGLDYLIRAFRTCRTTKHLVIAGGVDPACRDYYEKLLKLAEGDPRILFAGYVQEPLVSALYCNASVFVLPSDLEGMAHSLLEAMAAGCRCLVSNIPENASVLGRWGTTFRHGDVEDLREKLQTLLDAPEASPEQRKAISDYVLSSFRWEVCVDQLEAIFKEVSQNQKRRKNEKKDR